MSTIMVAGERVTYAPTSAERQTHICSVNLLDCTADQKGNDDDAPTDDPA